MRVLSMLVAFVALAIAFVISARKRVFASPRKDGKLRLAFLHPNCGDLGGGELVLWHMVATLQERRPDVEISIVAHADTPSRREVTDAVKQRFGIAVDPERIRFVRIKSSRWTQRAFAVATMLLQTAAAGVVALEALWLQHGLMDMDLVLDTTGLPGAYPVLALFGVRVATYTHYPTLSSDMLQRVRQQRRGRVVSVSLLKLVYYRLFALLYRVCGACVEHCMVNSAWTRDHMRHMWSLGDSALTVLFPPVDAQELAQFNRADVNAKRRPLVLSLGQFRPEKDHALQIRAFARFLRRRQSARADAAEEAEETRPRLALLGGVRNERDRALLSDLREQVESLGLSRSVEFHVNATFARRNELLRQARVGVHSMWNEHFGIGVVEMMAAGLIVCAHDSGGPRSDIVSDARDGFLCGSEEE
ncbi:MAG: hypothetical protein MHM6MM_006637, partial [Cercozoa sp. M6MM]